MMNVNEFIDKLKLAANTKTLYVMGCFGAPMNASNKARYKKNNPYNTNPTRMAMIDAASSDTNGFDCVCLIKGILWGWNNDDTKIYGGANYGSNGVPDIGADQIIKVCSNYSKDFTNIQRGELVHMSGHVGIYIGDGQVIECTPKWTNNVQYSWLGNLPQYKKGNYRVWVDHGFLPYVDYSNNVVDNKVSQSQPKKTNEELAKEVLEGKWGSGTDRKNRLTAAGYNYSEVQSIVNKLCAVQTTQKPTTSQPIQGSDNATIIWNYLKSKGFNDYACAGIMGNMNAESALIPNNLQTSYEKKLGYNDTTYTQAVDNGTYTNFVKDAAGYGLTQTTYWTRKQSLLNLAKSTGRSIGAMDLQLDFFWQEIQGYKHTYQVLQNATSVRQASDVMLLEFERPADQSVAVQEKRASYGQNYYNMFASTIANNSSNNTNSNNSGSNIQNNYKTYTVKKGDTLWGIAQSQLGNGNRYKEISSLNNISNSNVIHTGQVLKIPNK